MLESGVTTVGTAATVIDTTDVMRWRLRIHNNDNTDAVYIGGAAVTTANGLLLKKEESLELDMEPNDRVFAVSTKAGHTVSFIKVTQVR